MRVVLLFLLFAIFNIVTVLAQQSITTITNPYCGSNPETFEQMGFYSNPANAFKWGDPVVIPSGQVSPTSGEQTKYIYFHTPGIANSEFVFNYLSQGTGDISIAFYGFKSKQSLSDPSIIYNAGIQLDDHQLNENKSFTTVKGYNYYLLKIVYTKTGSTGSFFSLNPSPVNSSPVCNFSYVICEECLPGFSPIPGNEYVLSAWVHQEGYTGTMTNFNEAEIKVQFFNSNGTNISSQLYNTAGEVIDGWQKIEGVVSVPINATRIQIVLNPNSAKTHYYDDVRFFPLDGSMISYVYDQRTLRLVAELDDRNYATLYEYDNEGKLIRVKKETEKGIMTIKESRQSMKKL